MKRLKQKFAGWLTFCITIVFLAPCFGVNVSAAPTKAQKKQELAGVQSEISDLAKQAAGKEWEIAEKQEEINVLEFDISAYTQKIAQTEVELQEAEEKEQTQYNAMKLRLRVMYEDNNTTYINLLLSGQSITEFLSDLEFVKQMVEYDGNLFSKLEDARKAVAGKKQSLEDEKSVLDGRKQTIETAKAVLVAEKAELDTMISKLNAEEAALIASIRADEEAERRTQQSIIAAGSHSATSVYKGGTFGYPCTTTAISSPFGYRIHPIYGTRKLHKGIDFPVGTGSSIMAAGDGTVILATTYDYGGYGYCVIVDHGGGVTTLYAHNSKVLVSVGQKVSRGQLIAYSGNTGNSTGPHCHFEVRVNGAATNPMNYF